jgi:glycerophosphoryl diester phosphodiesterase
MARDFVSRGLQISSDTWQKPFLRIGHSGAGAYAPPNTLKAIELALEYGVDMVEFDVRPCRDALVLYHTISDAFIEWAMLVMMLLRRASRDIGEGERIPLAGEAIDLSRARR